MASATGAVKFDAIHKVRQANLKKVIDARFEGNASACARAIDTSHTFMWQIVNGYRTIGEKSARNIERALKLGANALDQHEGGRVRYVVAPRRDLADLDAKTTVIDACPDIEASEKTFSLVADEVTAQNLVEIERDDLLFVDPKQPLKDRRFFVVRPKRGPALVLQYVEGTRRFRATQGKRDTYKLAEVRVFGRVILVVHHLK